MNSLQEVRARERYHKAAEQLAYMVAEHWDALDWALYDTGRSWEGNQLRQLVKSFHEAALSLEGEDVS